MCNATEENRHVQTDTRDLPPNEGVAPCPVWCVQHDEFDQESPDHGVIHYGPERQVAGYAVQLRRCDVVRQHRPGAVGVLLDGEEMGAGSAAALGALLSATAAGIQMQADEKTVIRDLDLHGQDYVLFADCNVLAVSSGLDEAGRERAIAEARRAYNLR